ncbi:MAG TPA: GDSL-type esterase/lipase family protein [Ferruginibacter sp.]|jgi:lysophospholipase L1-like esterase|nr:G-D-S-L family lipolytic protein [Ferruginibacter sp.]HMX36319.1 GDSL-type esterase/lipase family protein [Ferruginibacter sp.]HNH22460.1 GDSL-type esterase/lipase family protein [Ferruginibacter sp.]HNL64594.1 GDSL-type esterase/lipase family protein [Ferruginibacter sp.]HQR01131.1 GDSL-type esterase/lipase family protein [Ferruginibacter sp.]
MKRILFFLALVILVIPASLAQPYAKEIADFKKQDSLSFPESGQILFVGSSSFTLWKDVQQYFPQHPIINRGFGGSTLLDVTRYEADIIFPYKPKQIVIYCGENDIANDSTVTGAVVFERFKKLYDDIRLNLGKVPIVYVSMKPSPSRWHLRAKQTDGNERIRKFLRKKKRRAVFVDVWPGMLGADGKPREELYIADKLHMNAQGYIIWQKLLEPLLLK